MSAARPRRAALALGAVLLAGCGVPESFESELVACRSGEDGTPANGVVLMAQSVPSAQWVPCLDTVPMGWHFGDLDARDGEARFWLDSDRDGLRAIEVQLTASCDTDDATEIPSDRSEMRRLEQVTQLSPQYIGTRFYVFEGGCIAVLFTVAGQDRAEPLAVATQGIDAVPREQLRTLVREESDGRLELDPPRDGGS